MARICHRCVADWKDRREILNMESRHPKAEVGDAKGCGLSFHHFFFSLSLSLSLFFGFYLAVQLPREQIADYR